MSEIVSYKLYKSYVGSGIEELGVFSLGEVERIKTLLLEAEKALLLSDVEGHFAVGLSRSDQDFIEVFPIGNGQYRLYSDRISSAGAWWQAFISWLQHRDHIDVTLHNQAAALNAFEYYQQQPRSAFERHFL